MSNLAIRLAIRGHATRGKEVIQILEMLGGKNREMLDGENFISWEGSSQGLFHFINVKGEISAMIDTSEYTCNYTLYTLEEFLEKYPYKVGDKVKHEGEVKEVIDMKWDADRGTVVYTISGKYDIIDCYNCIFMHPYKEQETTEEQIMIEDITLEKSVMCTFLETVEGKQRLRIAMNEGFELKEENGNFFICRKKIEYPKTYVECAKLLDCFGAVYIDGYKGKLLITLQELIICRNAYWKLAGNWNPNMKGDVFYINSLPSYLRDLFPFPIEEMKNEFYNNFKKSIEQCKKLLEL